MADASQWAPFMARFGAPGVEPDQRMAAAFRLLSLRGNLLVNLPFTGSDGGILTDGDLLWALCRQNSILNRYVPLDKLSDSAVDWALYRYTSAWEPELISDMELSRSFKRIMRGALNRAQRPLTLGVREILRELIETAIEYEDDSPPREFYSAKLLSLALYGDDHSRGRLSREGRLQELLKRLETSRDGAEDFEYVIALREGRLVFRVVSVLDDYGQETRSGLIVPRRALLTHFRDNFGGFTSDEIEELEELMNSTTAKERDYQAFFERHPHFLRKWDYREVHPQVHLAREGEGPLVPDFILTDRELQKAAVIELKLPRPRIVRRQENRDRFAAALTEARAQLLRYRDWFEIPEQRAQLKQSVGMEIYRPQLAVIIGRSSEFFDEVDRARLSSDNPDIEVVTYDDIVTFASRRRLVITGE